jgi:hypothetical protein
MKTRLPQSDISEESISEMMRYLIARICGFAKAFANRMEIVTPLWTLFTRAGLKQTMHVPDLCRTLG